MPSAVVGKGLLGQGTFRSWLNRKSCSPFGKMNPINIQPALVLLVTNAQTRNYLEALLKENHHPPLLMSNPLEVVQALKNQVYATVFMDCEAAMLYGPGLYSKIKVASQYVRLVLLCDRRHKSHREIIREAMEIGVYACLLAPYEDWEVLAMVSHYPPLETAGAT